MQEMPAREVTITLFQGTFGAVQESANAYLARCHVTDHLVDVHHSYQAAEFSRSGERLEYASHSLCLVTRVQERGPLG